MREDPGVNELLVHLLMMNCSHVEATFSAVDDGGQVADAIGRVFDAVLTVHQPAERVSDDRWEKWPGATEDLDPRVHVDDLLANFDTYNDFRVFDA